jgi:two-component system LytT family response regulator
VAEGVEAIRVQNPDVVFLDIEMPNESGFELIEKAKVYNFSTVFITAFSEHAVKAFKVSALDYLLKPVQREELAHTITKLEKVQQHGGELAQQHLLQKLIGFSAHTSPKIGLPSLQGLIFINVHEIVRCEADDNYTLIFLPQQKHVISRTLKDVEETLKAYNFMRVHKSHLVNLDKVVRYQKQEGGVLILQDNSQIPVGRQTKEELEKRLMLL